MPKYLIQMFSVIFLVLISMESYSAKGVNSIDEFSPGSYVENEVVVKFVASGLSEAKNIAKKLGASSVKRVFPKSKHHDPVLDRWRILVFPDDSDLNTIISELKNNKKIEWVELNSYVKKQSKIPNDPSFLMQWSLNNTGQTGGINDADIDAIEAWEISRNSRDVIVAVVDSGVDYSHEDLRENMWVNPGEIEGNGIDDDGNGCVDDIYGCYIGFGPNPFIQNKLLGVGAEELMDEFSFNHDHPDYDGHGTHVAGIIGAVGNNGIGISGVAWNSKIMAVSVQSTAIGTITYIDAITGIRWAVDNGANIVNFSIANNGLLPESSVQLLQETVTHAQNNGVLIVQAAGNLNRDIRGPIKVYPGAFENNNLIVVANLTSNNELAFNSNYNSTYVDIAAPGTDILSTVPKLIPGTDLDHGLKNWSESGYRVLSGTSMAAPHVTGALALLWAQHPEYSYSDVRNTLLTNSTQNNSLSGKVSGGRVLNLQKPLSNSPRLYPPSLNYTKVYNVSSGQTITLNGYVDDPDTPSETPFTQHSFEWKIKSFSDAAFPGYFSSVTSSNPNFNLPNVSNYQQIILTVVVNDGDNEDSQDIIINVSPQNVRINNPPVVSDRSYSYMMNAGNEIILDSPGYDPDLIRNHYFWYQVAGTTGTFRRLGGNGHDDLNERTVERPGFTPNAGIVEKELVVLEAVVSDGVTSEVARIEMIVSPSQNVLNSINHPPILRADTNQPYTYLENYKAFSGQQILLNFGVSDADNDSLTYSWNSLGTPGHLSNTSFPSTTYTVPTLYESSEYPLSSAQKTAEFMLKVSDGRGGTGIEYISFQIEPVDIDEDLLICELGFYLWLDPSECLGIWWYRNEYISDPINNYEMFVNGMEEIFQISDYIPNPTTNYEMYVNQLHGSPTASTSFVPATYSNTNVTLIGGGTDTDGEIVSYEWLQVSGTNALFVSGQNSSTAIVTLPNVTFSEILKFQLVVTDDSGKSSTDVLEVTVNPLGSISGYPPFVLFESEEYEFLPTTNGFNLGTTLFSIVNKPSWVNFNTSTGMLSGSPGYSDAGVYNDIVISVTDGNLSASLESFSINVLNRNRIPVLNDFSISVTENKSYSGRIMATDPDADTLEFSVFGNGNSGTLIFTDPASGDFTYTPNLDSTGVDILTVEVDDGSEKVQATLTINIIPPSAEQTFGYVHTLENPYSRGYVYSVHTDSNDNVFQAGSYTGYPDFDPSPLVEQGSARGHDAYVLKTNADGTYAWTWKTTGTRYHEYAQDVTTDTEGNVYITGSYSGSVDFDPSDETHRHRGGEGMFLVKLNKDGNYLWSLGFESKMTRGSSIALDSAGNIYMTGNMYYSSTIDFDPTDGVDNKTKLGSFDMYVTRINEDGTYGWTYTTGGASAYMFAYNIDIDDQNRIYVSGRFSGTVDLVGDTVAETTSNGEYDAFVVQFEIDEANEKFIPNWKWTAGGTGEDLVRDIVLTDTGILLAGTAYNAIDYAQDGSSTLLGQSSVYNVFLTRLNFDGSYGGTRILPNRAGKFFGNMSVDIDGDGSLYVSGTYSGTVSFDPNDESNDQLTGVGDDVYVTKYDANDVYVWTQSFGGNSQVRNQGLSVTSEGNIYLSGTFYDTADFDPGLGIEERTSVKSSDIYLLLLTKTPEIYKDSDGDTLSDVIELVNGTDPYVQN